MHNRPPGAQRLPNSVALAVLTLAAFVAFTLMSVTAQYDFAVFDGGTAYAQDVDAGEPPTPPSKPEGDPAPVVDGNDAPTEADDSAAPEDAADESDAPVPSGATAGTTSNPIPDLGLDSDIRNIDDLKKTGDSIIEAAKSKNWLLLVALCLTLIVAVLYRVPAVASWIPREYLPYFTSVVAFLSVMADQIITQSANPATDFSSLGTWLNMVATAIGISTSAVGLWEHIPKKLRRKVMPKDEDPAETPTTAPG